MWIIFQSFAPLHDNILKLIHRTLHPSSSTHVSPTPNSAVANAPNTGYDDIRMLLPEVTEMISRLAPVLNEASSLSERSVLAEPTIFNRSPSEPQVSETSVF